MRPTGRTERPGLLPRHAGRALLRRLSVDDLPAFHAYRRDPAVGRYQGWSPMSEAEALAFIKDMAVAELLSPGVWGQLAIARAADGALVGDLGLFVSASGRYAELGVTISPEAQGRGYASAAVAEALSLLFEQTGVERVIGVTDARNGPSVKLLERVGMSRVESREAIFKGEPCVEWLYAKSRSGSAPAWLEP